MKLKDIPDPVPASIGFGCLIVSLPFFFVAILFMYEVLASILG